jgi:thiol-disulfide isomerase/thioredoxin
LQAPAETRARWESLKGQVVVLEFWATWCSGCVAQIPHLNQLVEKFKDKPVRFISVTDEDKSVVTTFLKQRPIAGWVGLDAGSVTFTKYGVWGRPYTALVDADGFLRAMVPPTQVDEATIEQLLSGTLEMKQPPFKITRIGTEPNSPMPIVQTLVRPAMAVEVTGMSPGITMATGNRWEAWGMDMRSLVATGYGISPIRIVLPEEVGATRYDLSLVSPDDNTESRNATLRHLVENDFHLSVRKEVRDTEVMVLRMVGDGSSFQTSAKGRPMSAVVHSAELRLNRVVVDETALTGNYVFVLPYPKTDEELFATIKNLGLSLTAERRPLEVAVVEHVQK